MKEAIGPLRHRLVIEAPQAIPDGGGGETITWSTVGTVWAAVRPVAGRETLERDRASGTIGHEVKLRYRDDVVPEMRFRMGARLFHILTVVNVDEGSRWLRCFCEERSL